MPIDRWGANRNCRDGQLLKITRHYAQFKIATPFVLILFATGVSCAAGPTWIMPDKQRVGYRSLTLSADGHQLAFFGRIPGQEQDPLTLQVWDLRTKKRFLAQQQWDAGGTLSTQFLAFLANEKAIVAAAPRRIGNDPGFCMDVAIINNPIGGARVKYSLPPGRGEVAVFSPDGKTVAVTCGLGTSFALHDIETGKELRVFRGDELPVPANEYTYEQKEVLRLNLTKMLAFSPDGKCVAVGTSGGWVSVWDINQRGRIWRKQPKVKDNQIRSLAFSPDSKWLASANDSLAIWRVSDGYQVNDGKTLAYRTLFLPGKKLLLVDPRSIHGFMCWDLTTGRYLNEDWRLPRPTYTEKGVDDWTLSADYSTLAIMRNVDQKIEIWNVKDLIPK